MRAPAFWDRGTILPTLLAPAAGLYAAATFHRAARPGWMAPVPVICCGNASAGGAGKTTLALDLGARLQARGTAVAFLTRGYGGRGRGPAPVPPDAAAAEVGDEALLLAALAPCYRGTDRAATARLATAAGAQALVMDDGLQNPTLTKTLSILVIDGEAGFGNGRVIPAGPLREPIARAASRCQAAVLIGPDRRGALALLPATLPVLHARLQSRTPPLGRRVLAFAGIGRPEKFFAGLEQAGVDLVACRAFPDHHRFTSIELAQLMAAAAAAGALPVTTPKDAVRLPPAIRAVVQVVDVDLLWDDPDAPERLLDQAGLP